MLLNYGWLCMVILDEYDAHGHEQGTFMWYQVVQFGSKSHDCYG